MNRIDALKELLAKVEAGEDVGALTHLVENFKDFDGKWEHAGRVINSGSIDAAKALHEAVLPGWSVNGLDQACNLAGDPWGCEIAYFDGTNPGNNRKAYSGHNYQIPARAWLIAILKALIAEANGREGGE